MTIEVSRAEIANFKKQAQSGAVKYDVTTARDCALHYDQLAGTLTEQKQKLAHLSELGGFGGFDSAQQLRKGFNHKADEAHRLLDQYIAAAYQMKEAFLISGGLYHEADEAAAEALKAAAKNSPLKEGHR